MKAFLRERYGSPAEVLELRAIDQPTPSAGEVLVRVRATSVNPADWYGVSGPLVARAANGLRKPKEIRIGTDFSGTVEAVGAEVTEFQPGDDVFGARTGALAEYVVVAADRAIVRKPANVTFEEAGAVGIAGVTALQGLRDKGQLQPGQSVLINGASGGVGTFAVQIAKALGAEVTAVCSPRNVERARSLGADHVIDYTREDFTRSGRRYDLILDNASTKSWSAYRRVLKPDATLVMVGAPKGNRIIGPLGHIARIFVAGRLRGSQKVAFFVAKLNKKDLQVLADMMESGKLKPVVERVYPFSDAADAFRHLGDGHAQGKIVVAV